MTYNGPQALHKGQQGSSLGWNILPVLRHPMRQVAYETQQPAYLEELQNIQECLRCGLERPVEPVRDVDHHVERRLESVIRGIQCRDTGAIHV